MPSSSLLYCIIFYPFIRRIHTTTHLLPSALTLHYIPGVLLYTSPPPSPHRHHGVPYHCTTTVTSPRQGTAACPRRATSRWSAVDVPSLQRMRSQPLLAHPSEPPPIQPEPPYQPEQSLHDDDEQYTWLEVVVLPSTSINGPRW